MSNDLTPTVSSLIDTSKIDAESRDLVQKIINESSPSETQELMDLFNFYIAKKGALRRQKLEELQGMITDEMIHRFTRRSSEMSNGELIQYAQSVDSSIEKTEKSLNSRDTIASIQVQNNTTNVTINGPQAFDSDSKSRIADAIRAILEGSGTDTEAQPIDAQFTDVDEKQ